jgi:hypothetical protein
MPIATLAGRVALSILMLVTIATMISGCARQPEERKPSVDPGTVKQQMIDAVDGATSHLGGKWKPRTEPDYAESCQLSAGEDGAQWV